MGLGASMGQFLLCAGAKGKRFALPHARILMHQPLGGVRGDATDIAIQAEQMVRTKARINQLIAKETGQPLDRVAKDTDRDYWMTVDEAVSYGIVSNIIESIDELS